MLPTLAVLSIVAVATLLAVVCRDPPAASLLSRAARRAAWRELAERDMSRLAVRQYYTVRRGRHPCGRAGCTHATPEGASMCRMLAEIERSESING